MSDQAPPSRQAACACACGQLRLRATGDPVLVSSCHCRQCQRRTGALYGVTAYFAREQISDIEGAESTFHRTGDSGGGLTFHFCPTCGSTVYWEPERRPGMISVAAGAFADPGFPPPARSIWMEAKHPWVILPEDLPTFPQNPS